MDLAKYKSPIIKIATQTEVDHYRTNQFLNGVSTSSLQDADLIILVNIDRQQAEIFKNRYGAAGSFFVGKEYTKLLLKANY